MTPKEWILLKDMQPSENELVWLYNIHTNFIALGCLVYVVNEGWFWGVSNGTIYVENSKIVSECEFDDDYAFTHFCELPKLP